MKKLAIALLLTVALPVSAQTVHRAGASLSGANIWTGLNTFNAGVNVSGTNPGVNDISLLVSGTTAASDTGTQIAFKSTVTFAPTGVTLGGVFADEAVGILGTSSTNVSNIESYAGFVKVNAGYSGTMPSATIFEALLPTNLVGTPFPNYAEFYGDAISNGNGLVSGTVTNSAFNSQGITAGDSGGTVNNNGFTLTMPNGAQGAGTTTNIGLNIHGTGGAGATNHAILVANGAGDINFGTNAIVSPTLSGTVAGANTIPLSILAQAATNTVLGNFTSGTANITAQNVASCSAAGNALIWTTNTGFGCATGYATLASPTFTGTVTAPDGSTWSANKLRIAGGSSTLATMGTAAGQQQWAIDATNINDSTDSGTIATVNIDKIYGPAMTSTSATTFTTTYTLDIEPATCSGSLTCTNLRSLRLGGGLNIASQNITSAASYLGNAAAGANVLGNTTASNTVPTLVPRADSANSGAGANAAGAVDLIAAGADIFRVGTGSHAYAVGFATAAANETGYACYNSGSTPANEILLDTVICLASLRQFKIIDSWMNGYDELGELMKLKPAWGHWNQKTHPTSDTKAQPFLIAEDVEKVDPRLAAYDAKGKLKGVRYDTMSSFIVASIQAVVRKDDARFAKQQNEIAGLKSEIAALQRHR